jgi:hypothetical protein
VQDIPRLEMPLHTLIELVPKPDGKMAETRIKVLQRLVHGPCARAVYPPHQVLALPAGVAQPQYGLDRGKLCTGLGPSVARQPCGAGQGVLTAHTHMPTDLLAGERGDGSAKGPAAAGGSGGVAWRPGGALFPTDRRVEPAHWWAPKTLKCTSTLSDQHPTCNTAEARRRAACEVLC